MFENVNISKIRILKNCEICNDDEDVDEDVVGTILRGMCQNPAGMT